MDDLNQKPLPVLSHAEPVLAVTDLLETITYWQQVLGFRAKWTWGDPPVHGGVSWQKVFIQFTQNPEKAAKSSGNAVWIRTTHVASLYEFHQKNKADIVYPLTNEEWGLAQFTVKEINGYYLHFAGEITEREKIIPKMPASVKIIARKPTVEEFRALAKSVGWGASNDDNVVERSLNASVAAFVAAENETGSVIGCALLLGDHTSFYYVKDVMVHPDWQRRQVGTELMRTLKNWLDQNGANNALVGLFTGNNLESFYERFDFQKMFGMGTHVRR